jgi:hypothetical protein
MKRIKIEFSTRPYRAGRRGEPRSAWNEWIDDETDLRKLGAAPKLNKVRRAMAWQSSEAGR